MENEQQEDKKEDKDKEKEMNEKKEEKDLGGQNVLLNPLEVLAEALDAEEEEVIFGLGELLGGIGGDGV